MSTDLTEALEDYLEAIFDIISVIDMSSDDNVRGSDPPLHSQYSPLPGQVLGLLKKLGRCLTFVGISNGTGKNQTTKPKKHTNFHNFFLGYFFLLTSKSYTVHSW